MAEYIEREAAMAFLRKCRVYKFQGQLPDGRICHFSDVRQGVEDIPAADVESVVRCRDCKHWMEAALRCNHPDLKFRIEKYFTGDCFCSFGKQKRSVTGHE